MKIINRIEEVFVSFGILLATILVLVNVVLRQMGSGLTWSEELIRFIIIWITFIGMSVCSKDNDHMSIEFIAEMLNGKANKLLMAFIYLLALILGIMLTWYSFQLFLFSLDTAQVTPGLDVPFYFIYLIIPISGVLLIIRYIQQLIKLFNKKQTDNQLEGKISL